VSAEPSVGGSPEVGPDGDRRLALDDLVACPGCDLLHHRRALANGERMRCSRCRTVMATRKPNTVDRALAACLAGLVLLALSLSLPFLALSRSGIESRISVLDAIATLWASELRWLGLLTLFLIVLLPLARLGLLAWVLVRLRTKRPVLSSMRTAFRWAIRLEPWAMADVFMMGVAVSLVKLGSIARLELGLAFWSLCALIVVTVVISIVLCRNTVWERLAA